jgi:hypothetical protein
MTFIPKLPDSIAIPVQKNKKGRKYSKKETISTQELYSAAHNIILANKRGRLGEDELVDLLRMLAEGVSEQRIINTFKKTYNRGISSHTIKEYRQRYASRIMDISRDVDLLAVELGLTRRNMRVKKLQELAEALEGSLFTTDGELVTDAPAARIEKYLATLELIGQEMGDLSIAATGDVNFINMSDEQLKELAANKLAANPDMAKQLAERAGIRPSMPKEEIDEREYDLRELQDSLQRDDRPDSGKSA